MKSESLQKWALAAEIVGGIAVVATLIAVAVELSQGNEQQELNTSALEIAAYQNLVASFNELASLSVEDEELAKLIQLTLTNPEELTDTQISRMNFYYGMVFRHGDMAYFQYEKGAISQSRLDSMLGIVFNRVRDNPFGKVRWDGFRNIVSEEYVKYIEDRL